MCEIRRTFEIYHVLDGEGLHREETCTACKLIQSACEARVGTLAQAPKTESRPVPSCETYIGADDDDDDICINYL